jgi:hypothetical protein
MAFGTSCPMAEQVTKEVRKVYSKTLIVKLSPNVTILPRLRVRLNRMGQMQYRWLIRSLEWLLTLKSVFPGCPLLPVAIGTGY